MRKIALQEVRRIILHVTGQRIGYVRVSSFDQNPERQLEQIPVDKVFA
jgi:C-terminal processing protease CtpA/Prc